MSSVITTDEYNYLKELSLFSCPRRREPRDCWLDQDCPPRPNRCVECPSTRRTDWARETGDKQIINKTWQRHERNCSECELWIDRVKEPTHREACERAKHAKLILYLVSQGKTTIYRDPNSGWEVPA